MSAQDLTSPPGIDAIAAQRWAARVCRQSPWLHEEVAQRMRQRLDWITIPVQEWVHWAPARGGLQAHQQLCERLPKARTVVYEPHPAQRVVTQSMLQAPWWNMQRWNNALSFPSEMPVEAAHMVWSNMALHATHEPQRLIQQWYTALKTNGFLMFSCLGPDTLQEIRAVYQAMCWPDPTQVFTDMHDWGDMLVQTGFAQPVMDVERIVLTYDDPERLLTELRELGRNLHPQRFAACRSRHWRKQLLQALRHNLTVHEPNSGRLQLTFEVIYGHAIKPEVRHTVAEHTQISLDEMRRVLKISTKKE